MTTPADRTPELLAAIATLQQRLERFFEVSEERWQSQREDIDGLKNRVDAQSLVVQSVVEGQAASAATHKALAEGINNLNSRFDGLTAKVDGLTDDIAVVKGGHARSAMLRNAALVADALDCQLIAEVPQGVLLGFAKIAEANGEPYNDVQSFKNADMVLHVVNSDNQPGYITVEASFTIGDRDVTRAVRNAGYLSRYTGLAAYPVVAGVDILPDAQERVDNGEARLYRIQRRELQPG